MKKAEIIVHVDNTCKAIDNMIKLAERYDRVPDDKVENAWGFLERLSGMRMIIKELGDEELTDYVEKAYQDCSFRTSSLQSRWNMEQRG